MTQLEDILRAQNDILDKQKSLHLDYYNKQQMQLSQQLQDDKIALLENQNIKLIDTRIIGGSWTLTNLIIDKPLYITHSKGTDSASGYCEIRVASGSDDLLGGSKYYQIGAQGKSAGVVIIPKSTSVVLELSSIGMNTNSGTYDDTLRAYQ